MREGYYKLLLSADADNEPDFIAVESLLELACKTRSFRALFVPKFHCELNFIEQCWGYSKRLYRMCPVSSKEADLERNVLQSLNSIPLESIRRCILCFHLSMIQNLTLIHCPRFSTRSLRFMDCYRKGHQKKIFW